MITYTHYLDMVPGGSPVIVHLNQYDEDFRLVFNLYASSGTFNIESGTTVAIRGTKPDGNGYSVDATLSGTVVTVSGDQQLTAAAGKSFFELTLSYNDAEINTANFIIDVERAALDKDTLASGSVIRELVNVIDRTDEIIAAAHEADAACNTVATLTSQATTAKNQAVEAKVAAQNAQAEVERKAALIAQIKTNAEAIATQALQTAGNADALAAETANQLDAIGTRITNVELASNSYVDDGYVENGVAYFTHDGEILFEITGIGGGGSGGGGSDTVDAIMSVTNTTSWRSTSVANDDPLYVSFTWSSIEDEMPTGNGTLTINNNKAFKRSLEIQQGNVTVDIRPYLAAGSNAVTVKLSDSYGQTRSYNFSVYLAVLYITSTFDYSTPFSGAILFPYTPVGAVSKTVYFKVDGVVAATYTTSVSNRQLTQSIAAQTHGTHSLEVWFEAEVNGDTVTSNTLYYEFMSTEDLNTETIIASSYNTTTVSQYTTINLPFQVYNPTALTSEVNIYANSTLVSTQTVDRTLQSYSYRANDYGTLVLQLSSNGTTKTFTITVTESSIDVEAETENLVLYLTSAGRSNNEEHPEVWQYGNISATLTDFNYVSDGWVNDDDNITVLRVAGDARVTIPYKIFENDFRTTGKTIELEFATRDVFNYDATILSCYSGGRGLTVTAQEATLKSEQATIGTQYKENEHVRISFVCEKSAEHRLMFIYINGVASGSVIYPVNDDFSQVSPVNISIGSNNCTIDIYNIRIYDNDLSRFQIKDNWIADTQDGALMLERFTRNNIFDAYGNIVISQLPSNLPYLIRTAAELPQYKGDKKTIDITFVDPENPSRSFTATNVQSDVQGTSSQYYPRKNYKDKYRSGFVMNSGARSSTFAMNSDAIATNTFTVKADVASSEGANNVVLAKLFNDICPYKTPAQLVNPKVRQAIDGFACVTFWNDGNDTVFFGKGNFNNDKGTDEVFGFDEGDESWEIKNNTSNRVLWKSDDYTGDDWLNDFEARYPDTDPAYENPEQLQTFATWIKSTDTSAATNESLEQSVTYDGVTYTTDSAEYRIAKFKAEFEDYAELQSALFYYLFTELFLMVDSRAKNAFPSFIGSEVA